MKKTLSYIISAIALLVTSVSVYAANDVVITNNAGEMSVSTNTILVWDAKSETTLNDIFSELKINGTLVDVSKYSSVLDVRYLSWNVDKKVFDETDKITQWNKIFVLFKPISDGWMVWSDTVISFKTKNITLNEYGTVSTSGANMYDVVWKFSYTTKVDTPKPVEQVKPVIQPTQSVDVAVIKSNNTWIKDHIFLILLTLTSIVVLLISPLNLKLWTTAISNNK